MRITQWGEFGVHFTVYIAKQHARGQRSVNAAEIAEAQDVDPLYAQQILQRLRKSKVVESIRGPQGGYRLCKPPAELTLYDILLASEGDTLTVLCDARPLDPARCAVDRACGLRSVWYELRDHVDSYLKSITLEQLANRVEGDSLVLISDNATRKRK
jgi:Rrf2 family transcriptional regulator, cysteine metabolism repressor